LSFPFIFSAAQMPFYLWAKAKEQIAQTSIQSTNAIPLRETRFDHCIQSDTLYSPRTRETSCASLGIDYECGIGGEPPNPPLAI
jgi:hypothetical protein